MRRKASKLGLRLHKSRTRIPHNNDFGLYMIVSSNNYILWGESADLTLDEVEDILTYQEQLPPEERFGY